MNKTNPNIIRFIIAAIAALLFIPFLGGVHLFDWDEINFAEAAREMIVTGDYLTVQINYLPFWEKPPLFIYLQVLSMKVFGVNEFAARFPNAICGIVTLLVLFNIGRKLRNNRFGIVWVLAYAGSVLPFFYFKSGIIDPWFNLFIFLGVYYLMLYALPEDRRKIKNIVLSACFAGLAIMTKGPVGFLLIALTGGVYLLLVLFRIRVKFYEVVLYILVMAFVGGFWFIIQILNGHYETVVDFIIYQIRLFNTQDAGHGGFFGYHFVILFFGVFPASIFALQSFKRENIEDPQYALMKKWMIILFWVILILFSIVKTKIVHYSSLAYFPISFLAANYIVQPKNKKHRWQSWQSVIIVFVGIFLALPTILIPFVDKLKIKIELQKYIYDQFAIANLQADGGWQGFEFIPGLLYLIAIVSIIVLIKRKRVYNRAISLFVATIVFTFFTVVLIVPKVEKYSQNSLIEFLKDKSEEDVYLKNLGFKSYAPWFYGNTKPTTNENYYDNQWLLKGEIDKDVYFVTKIHLANNLEDYTELEKIGEKNGFVFYLRKAK